MRLPKLVIACLFLAATGAANAADGFTFSAPPGPHAVGFKVIQQYDRTRSYKAEIDLATGEPVKGERARPVQTLVWYPAARGGKPVTYRDYLDTVPSEDEFTRSPADIKRMTAERIEGNTNGHREALLRDIARAQLAVRDARAEGGKFPVVIYAPSYSAYAIENTDLCELLASHGYIVLSSPSLGAHTRAMTTDIAGLEAQAADISFLIGYAATLPQADTVRVAAVGFSWGGLANVFAAARDARIKALVSLDGSIRSFPKLVDGGKESARYVTPARVALPMLFVGARPKTMEALNRSENMRTDYSFMNEMTYSDVYIVSMLPMKHPDFASYALRMMPDKEFSDFGDYSRDEINLQHSWAARYTLRFLDAYLKGDSSGLAFLNNTPAANGVPAHTMLTDIRRHKGSMPPTQESFVRSLAAAGFDKAIPEYARFVAQNPAFKLEESALIGWGVQLARIERPAQAREIFRLGAHLYPNQSIMYDGLGEMQAKTGQAQEALASYRRVLELDPNNLDAIRYVKEHGAAAQGASAP
ncbi:dienelactone hydrolase family protein [Herbaspirillum sp. SJZ107]|uniref:dienelactone hydrolase family protein n=1 Tax=Herbaspirillum sp. SJZ107 TaxID=2572881 RepID=UPI00116A4C05|nr:dienelactone hydrolase family protein [Herbaspirillum sp. SJZ107]TQK10297.1 dienelactone hydrolase family protein [Herbaspirillum sp. SJZ107]